MYQLINIHGIVEYFIGMINIITRHMHKSYLGTNCPLDDNLQYYFKRVNFRSALKFWRHTCTSVGWAHPSLAIPYHYILVLKILVISNARPSIVDHLNSYLQTRHISPCFIWTNAHCVHYLRIVRLTSENAIKR